MHRVLIVANRTLDGERLRRKVIQSLAQEQCSFYVLVPATPNDDHPLVWTQGESRADAQDRLDHVLRRLRLLGADVDGQVGDHNPIHAIADVLRAEHFDEIVISTLPPGVSRWMRTNLARRVARRFGLPVTHVVADPIRSRDADRIELAPIIDLTRSRKQPPVASASEGSDEDAQAAEPPPASQAV